ncbi:MAG: AMIN domain-containing protein, partial [Gammaproteobacteria bacterium]
MSKKQLGSMPIKMIQYFIVYLIGCLSVSIIQITAVNAQDLKLSSLEFASQAGDKLQIQMEMDGPAIEPKVFHTDNPARIALDFPGVKNGLDKKTYSINQGGANSLYVAEAADRIRVVVNLVESVPFETKVIGNRVFLTLSGKSTTAPAAFDPAAESLNPVMVPSLLPRQAIKGIDFKRGENGEGRIL